MAGEIGKITINTTQDARAPRIPIRGARCGNGVRRDQRGGDWLTLLEPTRKL